MISIALFVARGLYLCGPSRSAAVSYDILLFFSDPHRPRTLQSHTSPARWPSLPIGNNFIDSSLCSSTSYVEGIGPRREAIAVVLQKQRSIELHVSFNCNANKFLTTANRIRIVCYLMLVWSNVLQTIQLRQPRLCTIVAAGDK